MTGVYGLQGDEETDADFNDQWLNHLYDLMTRQESAEGQYDIFAIPESGQYSAAEGSELTWLAHGMTLPPRVTMAADEGLVEFFLRYDDSGPGTFQDYTNRATVQLDQNVILVPIHVIQLYVPGDSTDDNGWYSQARARVTFDDYWQAYDYIDDIPFYSPWEVLHEWGDKPNSTNIMKHAQPDPIWSQCDIQFRMVSYTACPVDEDVFRNTEACGSGSECGSEFTHPQASTVINAADACADAQDKPGKRVIMTGSLDNEPCGCVSTTIGYADALNWAIVTKAGLGSTNSGTLAHELGHLLGIKYDTTNPDDLMYQALAPGSLHLLDTQDCNEARPGAQTFQDQVWPPP